MKPGVDRSAFVKRVVDRLLDTLPTTRTAVYLDADEEANAYLLKKELRQALSGSARLVLSKQVEAGAIPVPDTSQPGGHVHVLAYVYEPPPQWVLVIGQRDGKMCVSACPALPDRSASTDPFPRFGAEVWTECAP